MAETLSLPVNLANQKRRTIRKRCRSGVYSDQIGLDSLLELTHLPSHLAAARLGLGITAFKRLCRVRGLGRWPYNRSNKAEIHSKVAGVLWQGMAIPGACSAGSSQEDGEGKMSGEETADSSDLRRHAPWCSGEADVLPPVSAPLIPSPMQLQQGAGSPSKAERMNALLAALHKEGGGSDGEPHGGVGLGLGASNDDAVGSSPRSPACGLDLDTPLASARLIMQPSVESTSGFVRVGGGAGDVGTAGQGGIRHLPSPRWQAGGPATAAAPAAFPHAYLQAWGKACEAPQLPSMPGDVELGFSRCMSGFIQEVVDKPELAEQLLSILRDLSKAPSQAAYAPEVVAPVLPPPTLRPVVPKSSSCHHPYNMPASPFTVTAEAIAPNKTLAVAPGGSGSLMQSQLPAGGSPPSLPHPGGNFAPPAFLLPALPAQRHLIPSPAAATYPSPHQSPNWRSSWPLAHIPAAPAPTFHAPAPAAEPPYPAAATAATAVSAAATNIPDAGRKRRHDVLQVALLLEQHRHRHRMRKLRTALELERSLTAGVARGTL